MSKKGSEFRALEEVLDVIYFHDNTVEGGVTGMDGVSVASTALKPVDLHKIFRNEEFGYARTVMFSNVVLFDPLFGKSLRTRGVKKERKGWERYDIECIRALCLAVPKWWKVRAIDRASSLPKDLL